MERVLKCARHFFLLHLVSLKEPLHTGWTKTIDHDEQAADPPTTSGPKSGKNAKLETDVIDVLKDWLKDLPTVDSHYCRSRATYKDKKFLLPGTTISQLHREYQQAAATAGVRAVGIQHFTRVMFVFHSSMGISVRQNMMHMWTRKMKRGKRNPATRILQVHNFTLFDLKSKEGYCYIWEESEGKVFAHLQYSHFKGVIKDHPEIKEIVVWSDGCGYQNRKANVANAFSELARKYGVLITQKYLVAGHTQMESLCAPLAF